MTHNRKRHAGLGLMLGALGVVFGDIGTSPLYALKIVLGLQLDGSEDRAAQVYGLTSLLVWTVMLIVSFKYVLFVMRANNRGEGGIMALVALINGRRVPRKTWYVIAGLVGVALFYGDSVVTPAISVLSAVEGLRVITPELGHVVVPITLAALLALFGVQRYGTAAIGRYFGPLMLVWFATIGLGGLWQVAQHPAVLVALSPTVALSFVVAHPGLAFVAMGAIVLAVTGAEALYADMGHFGRQPVARTWSALVLPALALCYLGQSALVVRDPATADNPFFLMFPAVVRLPLVVLATLATLIASQAVISGAFSLTRQAIQLGFLPRMRIRQTSETLIGQIYLPFVNVVLFVLVTLLVLAFGSSERLAGAYGVAVSGTLAIDSLLFMAVALYFWHRSKLYITLFAAVFLTLDMIVLAANVPKLVHGGWLPLVIAVAVLVLVRTWIVGRRLTVRARRRLEKPLKTFVIDFQERAKQGSGSLVRLPGQAVYIGHHAGLTPTALRMAVEELHELHDKAVIVYMQVADAAHVHPDERVVFDELGYADGISQVTITYGFHDTPNIPKTLETVRRLSPELDFDAQKAVYFISLSHIVAGRKRSLPGWQKSLYMFMAGNSLSASDYYRLPLESTVEMRTLIKV